MSASLRNKGDVKVAIRHAVQFALPSQATELLASIASINVPERLALQNASFRMDTAAMSHRRRVSLSWKGDVVRYINPDLSPQGREVFGCKLWEVYGDNYIECCPVICPLSTLAHGNFSTADKAMCITHMAFLLTGPDRAWKA